MSAPIVAARHGVAVFVSIAAIALILLASIVAGLLFVEIDSAEILLDDTVYPTVDRLRLRRTVPLDLSEPNVIRYLGEREALLVIERQSGVFGTWLKVKDLAQGDTGWVAGWLVASTSVKTQTVRRRSSRLGARLLQQIGGWMRKIREGLVARTGGVVDNVVASLLILGAGYLCKRYSWGGRRHQSPSSPGAEPRAPKPPMNTTNPSRPLGAYGAGWSVASRNQRP